MTYRDRQCQKILFSSPILTYYCRLGSAPSPWWSGPLWAPCQWRGSTTWRMPVLTLLLHVPRIWHGWDFRAIAVVFTRRAQKITNSG